MCGPFWSHQCSASIGYRRSQVTKGTLSSAACSPGTALHGVNWHPGNSLKSKSVQPFLLWVPLLCLCFAVFCLRQPAPDHAHASHSDCVCLIASRETTKLLALCSRGKWQVTVSFQGLWLKLHGWIVRYAGTKRRPFSLAYKCSDGSHPQELDLQCPNLKEKKNVNKI